MEGKFSSQGPRIVVDGDESSSLAAAATQPGFLASLDADRRTREAGESSESSGESKEMVDEDEVDAAALAEAGMAAGDGPRQQASSSSSTSSSNKA